MDTDRNLLFGVLALQADLIDADRFAQACSLWSARKTMALADVLVQQGWLTAADRADVEKLLDRKLNKHRGNARAGLAEVTTEPVRQSLAAVADPEVHQSLAGLLPPQGQLLLTTTIHIPESRDRYTLSRLHATGGIGRVWLARDTSLGRDVALKELLPERAANPAVWPRFLKEAQITGQLEHPGIVPIYEVSHRPEHPAPFYTMRFVRGRTLSQATRSYHERRNRGEAGPMELRHLLGAFLGVCNAVAYAHSRGVLHRDLKPQNVVLGDYGEVIVLDWGLARLMGETEADAPGLELPPLREVEGTIQGEVLGTPAYMAPEQAEGRLDQLGPATDVYGLGAILYEILSGQPPFGGTDTSSVLQQVIHEQPARPRILVPRTPLPLEAVCLKALAKSPSQRYSSAKELADEVQRWLADEPVSACREPWIARLRRWTGRHRTLVTATAAAMLVALTSLTLATVLLLDANRATALARDLALEHQQDAERQRDLAKQNFQLARSAVEEYTAKVANDPRLKEKDLEKLRQDLLQAAIRFFQQLTKQQGNDPGVRADLGRAFRDLAYLIHQTSKDKIAAEHGRKSLAMFEQLAAEYPDDPEYRREMGKSCTEVGGVLYQGDPAEVIALYRRAIALLEDLRRNKVPLVGLRKDLARAYRSLAGYLEEREHNPDEVTTAYTRAVEVMEEQANPLPQDTQKLAAACTDLAWRCREIGRPGKARELVQKAVRTLEGVLKQQPGSPEVLHDVALAQHILSWIEHDLGNRDRALAAMHKAAEIHDGLATAHPSLTTYQQSLARDLNNEGSLLRVYGMQQQAKVCYDRAREIKEKLAARYPAIHEYRADLVRTLHNQFHALDTPEAHAQMKRAGTILQELTVQHPTIVLYQSDLASQHHCLAIGHERHKRFNEAEAEFRTAIQQMEKVVEKDSTTLKYPSTLTAYHLALGQLQLRRGQTVEAEKSYRAAVTISEKMVERRPDNLICLISLGGNYCDMAGTLAARKPPAPAAGRLYDQAISRLREALRRDPSNVRAQDFLSKGYIGLANYQGAIGDKKAVETALQGVACRSRLVEAYPDAAEYRFQLAQWEVSLAHHQEKAAQKAEASASLDRAVLRHEKLVAEQPTVALYRAALADAYALQGLDRIRGSNIPEGIALFAKEVIERRKLVEQHPESDAYLSALVRAQQKRGEIQLIGGKRDGAAADFRGAIQSVRQLLERVPADQVPVWSAVLVEVTTGLSQALSAARKWDEAALALRDASTAAQRLTPGLPATTKAETKLMTGYLQLAEGCRIAGKVEPAANAYRQAQAVGLKVLAALPNDPTVQQQVFAAHSNCGALFATNGKLDDALACLKQTSALLDKLSGSRAMVRGYRTGLVQNLTLLIANFLEQKKPASAVACYRLTIEQHKALAKAEPTVERHRQLLTLTHIQLAQLLKRSRQFKEADTIFQAALPMLAKMARDHPEQPVFAILQGSTHIELALLPGGIRKPNEVLAEIERGLPILQKALKEEKVPALLKEGRNYLRLAYTRQGYTLRELQRHREAVAAYDLALELTAEAARTGLRVQRAFALIGANEQGKAIQEAEAVARLEGVKPGELYGAACVFSLASAGADKEKKVAETCAARALDCLRRAREGGFFKRPASLEQMKKEKSFDPLRKRADFQKLLTELEAGK